MLELLYLIFIFPIEWGIGVVFHGLAVFAFSENAPMMKRMIEKEMKALANK